MVEPLPTSRIALKLDALNFLSADVRNAFGPYINLLLVTERQWTQSQVGCARRSWRVPAGASPAQEGGSARLVASVAARKATTAAKRTQQLCGVWE